MSYGLLTPLDAVKLEASLDVAIQLARRRQEELRLGPRLTLSRNL